MCRKKLFVIVIGFFLNGDELCFEMYGKIVVYFYIYDKILCILNG